MIDIKDGFSGSGGLSAEALAKGADSKLTGTIMNIRTFGSSTVTSARQLIASPVMRPFRITKQDVESEGRCSTTVPATSSPVTSLISIYRQHLLIGQLGLNFASAGQIQNVVPITTVRDSVDSTAVTGNDVTMYAAVVDNTGQTRAQTAKVVDMSPKKVGYAIVDGVAGNYSVGPVAGNITSNAQVGVVTVVPFSKSTGLHGASIALFGNSPLGTYSNTNAYFSANEVDGTLTAGTVVQYKRVWRFDGNDTWKEIPGSSGSFSITARGGVGLNSYTYAQWEKGDLGFTTSAAIAYKLSTQSTWTVVQSSFISIQVSFPEGGQSIGAAANATLTSTQYVTCTVAVSLKEAIDYNDLGLKAYMNGKLVFDSENPSNNVIGINKGTVDIPNNTFRMTVSHYGKVGATNASVPADQLHVAGQPIEVDVKVPSNVNATSYRVWATGNNPGLPSNTMHLIYDGANPEFTWKGGAIQVDAIPTTNTTASYPATYNGQVSVVSGQNVIEVLPGDTIFGDPRTSGALQTEANMAFSIPIEFMD